MLIWRAAYTRLAIDGLNVRIALMLSRRVSTMIQQQGLLTGYARLCLAHD